MDSLKIGSDKSNSLFEVEMDSYEQDEFLESLSKTTTRKKRERAKTLTKEDFGGAGDMDEYAETLTPEDIARIYSAKDKKQREEFKEKAKKDRVKEWNDKIKKSTERTDGEKKETESLQQTSEADNEVPLQEARNKQFINRLNEWQQALKMIKDRNGGKDSGTIDAAVENIKSLMFSSTKVFSLKRVGRAKTPAYTKNLETIKETIRNLDKALNELFEESEKEVETKVIKRMAETSGKMLRYIDNEAGVAFEKGLVTTWATILEYSQGEYLDVRLKETEEEIVKREKAEKKESERKEKRLEQIKKKVRKEKTQEEKEQEKFEENELEDDPSADLSEEDKAKEKNTQREKEVAEEAERRLEAEEEEKKKKKEEKERVKKERAEKKETEKKKREMVKFDINKLITVGRDFSSLRGNPSFVVTSAFLKQLAVIQSMNGIVGEKERDFSDMIFTYEKYGSDAAEETDTQMPHSESTAKEDRKIILTGVFLKSKGRAWKASPETERVYEQDERTVIEYLSFLGLTGKTLNLEKIEWIKNLSIGAFTEQLKKANVAEDVVNRVTAQFVIAKLRLQGEDGFSEDKKDIQEYLYLVSQFNSQAVERVDGFYQPKMTKYNGTDLEEGKTYDLTMGEAGEAGVEFLAGDLTKAFIKLFTGKTGLVFKGIHVAKTQA